MEGSAEFSTPPEARDTRESVLQATKTAFSIVEETKDTDLSPQEIWRKKAVISAKEKTIAQGKDNFTNTFKDLENGKDYAQEEGIPTDILLYFISKKVDSLPPDSEEVKNLKEVGEVLERNSKKFSDEPDRMEEARLLARTRQEAYLISQDERQAPEAVGNWDTAKEALSNRLELQIPEGALEETAPGEAASVGGLGEVGLPPEERAEETERNYKVTIGSQHEEARKIAYDRVESRIQERLMERFPTHLPQNRILRAGRLIGHALNPHNWGKILFNNSKEYYRQTWMAEEMRGLGEANFGATNNLTQDAAELVNQMRQSGEATVERFKQGPEGVRAGETGPTEVTGEFRNYILDEVLRPSVDRLRPLLSDPAANLGQINTIENEIQRQLHQYVEAHQNDPQITEFFGRNQSRYGDLSEFYASDILETARKIVEDGKADEFASRALDEHVAIEIFRAKWASETEARFTMADRLLAAAERNRIAGRLINPATVGIMSSALTFLGMRAAGAGVAATQIATPLVGVVTGAAFAGLRRHYDTEDYYRTVARNMEAGQTAQPGSSPQREEIERFIQPLIASQQDLINGGGQELLPGATGDRASIDQLISIGNYDGLERRYGEIRARLDFPAHPRDVHRFLFLGHRQATQDIGLVSYQGADQMSQGQLELVKQLVTIREVLTDQDRGGRDQAALQNITDRWNQVLLNNAEAQRRAFGRYQLGESLEAAGGAAVIGGLVGLGGGLLLQGALGFTGEHLTPAVHNIAGEVNKMAGAVLEDEAKNRVGTWRETLLMHTLKNASRFVLEHTSEVGSTASGNFSIDQTKNLFNQPGNLAVNDHLQLAVDPETQSNGLRNATLLLDGNRITEIGPMQLDSDGHLILHGGLDNAPQEVKDFFGIQTSGETVDPLRNIREGVKDWFNMPNRHDTYQFGDLTVDVNPDGQLHDGQNGDKYFNMSMTLFENTDHAVNGISNEAIRTHGQVILNGDNPPTFNFDTDAPGNQNLTPERMQTFVDNLRKDGWDVTVDHHDAIASPDIGTGRVLDGGPDVLKSNGIIETDQFNKTWNFHVLRPDIVSSTGMHTHNELTLHLGGQYDVLTDSGVVHRSGVGQPGHLNFGGELTTKEIQSHLFGVPPKVDAVLAEMIRQNNGLKFADMLFTVDLIDGRQIMLPADASGNVILPPELYNHDTGGLIGVKDIAAIYIQKPDGTLLSASELLNSGQIPQGSVVHSLASERFAEVPLPPSAPLPAPPIPEHNTYHLVPPGATEFIPPPAPEVAEQGSPPIIPIPFYARRPLEPLEPSPGITFPPTPETVYYSGETMDEAQKWIKEHPESHKPIRKIKNDDGTEQWVDSEGKPVVRDIDRERAQLQEFLDNIKTHDPDHYAQIEELIGQVEPMNEQTRVAINIPAWMEGGNLYSLLELYTQQIDKNGQPLDPSLYELNIIVNRKMGDPADNSVAEIERFKTEAAASGKKFQINYLDVEFNPPFNNVGNARRVITNLTLLRSLQRPRQTGSLYIESEDADLLHIDPKTVINLIEKFDENPHLDAARGIQDRFPEKMMDNDFLFLYRRMQDFKEVLLRRKEYRPETNPGGNFNWNRVITGGWNTGYTAEAYALIGGYNPYQTKGEDMIMGERMSMARGDGRLPNTEVIGKVATRSDSSPRRYIYEVATGQAAYGENFEDPAVNALIRNEAPEQLLTRISHLSRLDGSNQEMFESMINNEYRFIRGTTPNEAASQEVAKFVLTWLGLKSGDYQFTPDGRIEVRNWSNVQAALNDYRTRHQTPRQPGERTRNTSGTETSLPAPTATPTPPATPTLTSTEVETADEEEVATSPSRLERLRNNIGQLRTRAAAASGPTRRSLVQELNRAEDALRRAGDRLPITRMEPLRNSMASAREAIHNIPDPQLPNKDAILRQLNNIGSGMGQLASSAGQRVDQERINLVNNIQGNIDELRVDLATGITDARSAISVALDAAQQELRRLSGRSRTTPPPTTPPDRTPRLGQLRSAAERLPRPSMAPIRNTLSSARRTIEGIPTPNFPNRGVFLSQLNSLNSELDGVMADAGNRARESINALRAQLPNTPPDIRGALSDQLNRIEAGIRDFLDRRNNPPVPTPTITTPPPPPAPASPITPTTAPPPATPAPTVVVPPPAAPRVRVAPAPAPRVRVAPPAAPAPAPATVIPPPTSNPSIAPGQVEATIAVPVPPPVPRVRVAPSTPAPTPIAPTPAPITTVESTIPIADINFVSNEDLRNSPDGLIGEVKRRLTDNTENQKSLKTTPDALADYMKGLEFSVDTKIIGIGRVNIQILDGTANIEGGKLKVHANVEAKKFGVNVKPQGDVVLETDPATGEVKVIESDIRDLGVLGPAKSLIQPYIANLNNVLVEQINKQVGPEWGISGIKIEGDRLAFDFRKTT